MNSLKGIGILIVACVLSLTAQTGFAAYNHQGDIDSAQFRSVYPDQVGTKLDSCTVCHGGGSYTSGQPPKTTTLGSCQWCHYVTNYGANSTPENLLKTLNAYGLEYLSNGRSGEALQLIASHDSDGDGYANQAEIAALTYPGDVNDDPSKIPAPAIVLSLKQLEGMPLHSQLLLMNASKSDDWYSEYTGVTLENLLKGILLDSATGVTVVSPDGFATYHPFFPTTNSNSYHIFGKYPPGTFHYDRRADIAVFPPDPPNFVTGGWCNYSSPAADNEVPGELIHNPEGLKMLLAFERDGEYLSPGVLNLSNKLDGEGPYRIIPPQKNPGPPDQRSSSRDQNVIWPYDANIDHNAGFSSRTVTMIKVEPLPAGTTDINTLEAGWPYVDNAQVVIYGSITPRPLNNLNHNLSVLIAAINSLGSSGATFKSPNDKKALADKVQAIKKLVSQKAYTPALNKLRDDVLRKTDGCLKGKIDKNDWIIDLEAQRKVVAEIQKIWVMLAIIIGPQ